MAYYWRKLASKAMASTNESECWLGSETLGKFLTSSYFDLLTSRRNLRRTIAGKDLPEDAKAQLISLHEEVGVLKDQLKDSQEKLHKAKAVCTFILCRIASSIHYSLSSRKTSFSRRSKPRKVVLVE